MRLFCSLPIIESRPSTTANTMETKKISPAAAGDEDEGRKLQDNRQSSPDVGRRDDVDDNEPKSLIMELYPWMQQFKKMCRTSLFQPSMTSLKHLMMYYTRNVRPGVNECYTKPLRAEKLKDSISESLLFFLYYYREIAEDHDRASYMDLMTDLLAMYIDMELKASKRGREHSSKIAARLSSCLQVYLEHSAEHLLDTLLKVHFMTHNYHEILDPVITKIFKGIQEHPNTSVMYVRYFLAYRLWKKLNKNVAVRNQINVSALASLGPAPSDFPPLIVENVLPKVPNTQKLSTKSLLLHKFDVDKCCEEFVKFCKRDSELSAAARPERNACSVPEDNDARVSNVCSNVVNVSEGVETRVSSSLNRETDANGKAVAASPLKSSSTRKSKKSNDIVFIDLTSDNVTEKVIRQKKTRRKLLWLKEAKKRINSRPPPSSRLIDSPNEDAVPAIPQLEDTVSLDSLRIESPRCREDQDMAITIEASAESRPTSEDREDVDEGSTIEPPETEIPTTITVDSIEDHSNLDQPMVSETAESAAEEKIAEPTETEVQQVESTVSGVTATEAETLDIATVNSSQIDELFVADTRTNDARASPLENAAAVARVNESRQQPEKLESNKAATVTRSEPIRLAIKAEHVTDEAYEIMDESSAAATIAEPPTASVASRVSLEIHYNAEISCTTPPAKIRESEFQENIDGLALLASVSQRVSHLTTTATPPPAQQQQRGQSTGGELIKVKNYASLANSPAIDEPVTSSDAQLPIFCPSGPTASSSLPPPLPASVVVNRVVGIYPEEAMDKVAYQVEVTSTGDVDAYENGCNESSSVQPEIASVVTAESTTQAEKDDTNVILNGETVVLFQKSPNSNLYIINKAVENRDHVSDELAAGIRDIADHANETAAFGYEFPYESVYRGPPSVGYELAQYNREVTVQETRRCKKTIGAVDSALEASGKASETMELTKPGKGHVLPLDVIGKSTTGKRKSSSSSASISRRRRIKQEYNDADLTTRIAPSYAIQDCAAAAAAQAQQERAEAARSSIHIPATHSSPLSSIYTTYTGGAELYLPCHKNCGSMTCGLPPPVTSKGSNGGKGHCSCLNCTYGIVAHCGECIMPSDDARATSIDKSPYYLPLHSAVQPPGVQDRGGVGGAVEESLVKIFDDQLVCKFELSGKQIDGVGVKREPKEVYRAELDNKLPLKKRFKAMMSVSFEEMSIKREKAQSYPSTPMISIAALDSQDSAARAGCTEGSAGGNNSLDLSLERAEIHGSLGHHANEMIRRDYHKDMMMMMPPPPSSSSSSPSSLSVTNGYRARSSGNSTSSNGNGERKRKRRTTPHSPSSCSIDETRHDASYQKAGKTSAKNRETTATSGVAAAKRLAAPNKSQVTRPSEKVKEQQQTQPDVVAPPTTKNSTRQTRSSKRNLPKVNYIYTDGDSDWNPSNGGSKRKRKKTSR